MTTYYVNCLLMLRVCKCGFLDIICFFLFLFICIYCIYSFLVCCQLTWWIKLTDYKVMESTQTATYRVWEEIDGWRRCVGYAASRCLFVPIGISWVGADGHRRFLFGLTIVSARRRRRSAFRRVNTRGRTVDTGRGCRRRRPAFGLDVYPGGRRMRCVWFRVVVTVWKAAGKSCILAERNLLDRVDVVVSCRRHPGIARSVLELRKVGGLVGFGWKPAVGGLRIVAVGFRGWLDGGGEQVRCSGWHRRLPLVVDVMAAEVVPASERRVVVAERHLASERERRRRAHRSLVGLLSRQNTASFVTYRSRRRHRRRRRRRWPRVWSVLIHFPVTLIGH